MDNIIGMSEMYLLGGLVLGFFALTIIYITLMVYFLKKHVDVLVKKIEELAENKIIESN